MNLIVPVLVVALISLLLATGPTAREMAADKGVSNFEFHYLGCAKILGAIGKGDVGTQVPQQVICMKSTLRPLASLR